VPCLKDLVKPENDGLCCSIILHLCDRKIGSSQQDDQQTSRSENKTKLYNRLSIKKFKVMIFSCEWGVHRAYLCIHQNDILIF
jgi:hypothetical protein